MASKETRMLTRQLAALALLCATMTNSSATLAQDDGDARASKQAVTMTASKPLTSGYVINLGSSRTPPAASEIPTFDPGPGRSFFVTKVVIDDKVWHRLRVGFFDSSKSATEALATIREYYPSAWVTRSSEGDQNQALASQSGKTFERSTAVNSASDNALVTSSTAAAATAIRGATKAARQTSTSATGTRKPPATATASATINDKNGQLMAEARKAMTAGEISRAVQLYTKVLQQPPNPYQQQAQEFLGLARERNGQIAHAKSEYTTYLGLYPDGDGANRVRQRLAVLTSQPVNPDSALASDGSESDRQKKANSPWNVRTFFSQYYRRYVNQVNDNEAVVAMSSVFSDINLDARRRGERFDFSTRVTAGYRNELLSDPSSSDYRDLRMSYAFAELVDSRTGLGGRVGRQSRNTGGVLGRFDGLNLTYQLSEKMRLEAVAGKPVFSTARGAETNRTFYGVSSNFGPYFDGLDIGTYYLQQDMDGITDRQVVGTEVRYVNEKTSIWGLANYDTSFQVLGNLFLQARYNIPGGFAVTGMVDQRRGSFLSIGNALLGEYVDVTLEDLAAIMSEEELRQIALERAPNTTTKTIGLSKALSDRFHLSFNASQSDVDEAPASNYYSGMPESRYRYFSADLVANKLVSDRDVSLLGLRYSDSESSEVWTVNLNTRFPIGRSFYVNPRLRVDHRQIKSDMSEEWIYSPGLRMQYRWGRNVRLELEAGKQFANRQLSEFDLTRDSYFINFGYQIFY